MPSATPKRRRVLDGVLSPAGLAFVMDEPTPRSSEQFKLSGELLDRLRGGKLELAWRSGQPQVLRRWIQLHPGTRPRCWWLFDAPEPLRAITDGRGEPLLWEVHLGRAAHWIDWSRDLAIESQAAYLRRHGLMTAGESRRFPPGAFESEPIFAGDGPLSILGRGNNGRN